MKCEKCGSENTHIGDTRGIANMIPIISCIDCGHSWKPTQRIMNKKINSVSRRIARILWKVSAVIGVLFILMTIISVAMYG